MAGQIVEVEADSLEDARQRVNPQIPPGLFLVAEIVLDDGGPRTATGVAETGDAAAAQARSEVPPDATVSSERTLFSPMAWTLTTLAATEQEAMAEAQRAAREAGNGVVVRSLQAAYGPPGPSGAGNEPTRWTAELFQPAIHEVSYRTRARVRYELADAPPPVAPIPQPPPTPPPTSQPAPVPQPAPMPQPTAPYPWLPPSQPAPLPPRVPGSHPAPVSQPVSYQPSPLPGPGTTGFDPPGYQAPPSYSYPPPHAGTQVYPGTPAFGPAPPPRPSARSRLAANRAVRWVTLALVVVGVIAALVLDAVAVRNQTPSPPFRVLSGIALGLAITVTLVAAAGLISIVRGRAAGASRPAVFWLAVLVAVVVLVGVTGEAGVIAAHGPSCLQRTGSGADLHGCDFSGDDLSGRDLTDADLTDADLGRANLNGARLGGAQLSGADLTDADLTDARLGGAHLQGADLSGAKLGAADLGEADLSNADLGGADLTNTELDGATVVGASFEGAQLDHTSLAGVNLDNAEFKDAALTAVQLDGSSLVGAKGLSDQALSAALGVAPGDLARTLDARRQPVDDPAATRTALAAACFGQAVPGAGTSPGTTFHPMEVFGATPPGGVQWGPPGLRFAELVGCVGDQVSTVVETCEYFFLDTLADAPSVTRLRWAQSVRIVNPATGAVVVDQTLLGPPPPTCPDRRSSSDPSELGTQVAAADVIGILAPPVGSPPA